MDQALATTLETLEPLLAKVAEVHGRQDPRLVTLALEFPDVRERLLRSPQDLAGAAAVLVRLAGLTDGFTPPEHACRSYRRALSDLDWLEQRLTSPTTPHHAAAGRPGATR
jgi:iron-sulfur cluster repair protein YtfE (RIC family)